MANTSPRVQLPNAGTVIGRFTQNSHEFLGIPYAQVSRWAPPYDMHKLPNDPFDASEFGPCCPQMETGIFIPSQDEDCLNLNVFAPHTMQHNKLVPVMVWIHGGNEKSGCSAQSIPTIYNGTNLLSKANKIGRSVVVVTINYRLSILGSLYLEELMQENLTGNNVNLYLQDVLSALRWVQKFISAFGGDPKRVLLFGQGSGGNIVLTLPTLREVDGLFSSVIAQSIPLDILNWVNVSVANFKGHEAASIVGCNRTSQPNMTSEQFLTCLRDVPSDVLTKKISSKSFGAVVDGDFVPMYPLWAYETGKYINLSAVIIGWNMPDDYPLCRHAHRFDTQMTMAWLMKNLPLLIGATYDMVEQAILEYNITTCKTGYMANGPHESCCWLAEKLTRDAVYTCPAWQFLTAMRDRKPDHQFWYEMNCCPKCPSRGRRWQCVCSSTAEIPYIFGTQSNYSSKSDHSAVCQWDTRTESFSEQVIDHWTSIATNSKPSDVSLQWLPFDNEHIFAIDSHQPFETKPWGDSTMCEFWEGIEGAISTSKFKGGRIEELWANPKLYQDNCDQTTVCSSTVTQKSYDETLDDLSAVIDNILST